jgi:hypothetical protein
VILPEAILEASATMIVGVLFVVTLWEAVRKKEYVATGMFWFSIWCLLPFSIASILVLFDYVEYAKWACAIGFASFAFWLTVLAYFWMKREE